MGLWPFLGRNAPHLRFLSARRGQLAAGAPLDHVNNLHGTATIETVVPGNGSARHQATLKALIEAKADLQLADRNGARLWRWPTNAATRRWNSRW